MLKNRIFLLLFVSVCLLRSTALFSDNGPVTDAVNDRSVPIQLSMLSESREAPALDEVVADKTATDSEHRADADIDPAISNAELAEQRQLFLQAEVALKNKDYDSYFLLADQLEEYPLYPYLQYEWLRKNLHYERQVKYFLEQYESTRYATRLKKKWLHYLAKKKQWGTFLEFYSESSDKSLNCYYHRAQYNTGDRQAALNGAEKLWKAGYSQPKVCDPLFAQLKKSDLFNQDLFWQRFNAALQNNKTSLAKYVKKLMPASEQKTANLWLKLHSHPERNIPELLKDSGTAHAQAPYMFTHAINRLARKDVNRAIELWDENKRLFDIDNKLLDKTEKKLALKLAYLNESDAYERLGQLNESDYNSKTWRIRAALLEQNWKRVADAIEDLSADEQQLEKWQYWLARAYLETGRPVQAEELLSDLSSKRDFYGYLAADRMNRLYQLSDYPLEITEQEIADIRNREAFRVAFELIVLDRDTEAKLQWWHALRQLDEDEIPAAAKLAQQWQWDEIAIFTIAKVKYWDDIELRFPLSYSDSVHENASLQNLNPVILFGMIRRESAFNKDAHSPVGARGLMQIMPQTARGIARDLDERWHGTNSLYDPVKNLKYGSYYYQKLLKKFDSHHAIALAAYNAGPNRVKKWLPDESMPADIWIETIPYRETREYVTTVLVYSMIYQQRIQSDGLTMNELTREVQPIFDVALK